MFHCKLAYSIPNTLKGFIRRGKDKLDLLSNQNVVYKISCDDCEASYVGQTKKKLCTRINEHISDINKRTGSPSVITDHCINYDHNINWNDIKILDSEPSYNKRLVSEMIHIKRQKQGINKQNDTDSLSDTYSNNYTITFPFFSPPSFLLFSSPSMIPFFVTFQFVLKYLNIRRRGSVSGHVQKLRDATSLLSRATKVHFWEVHNY
ncbi:hypothetical protein ALC62_00836 [Cyphomyrmex costatus]|uniref:GIY-YIG domain-containing protein n=1 Tax=Cyphomyrmex costatus TaxID=456900 RepID=A0A151IPV0_9HYME|nr:hypothetical protein ALC62_00836 [Cyphomyrmex costatus]